MVLEENVGAAVTGAAWNFRALAEVPEGPLRAARQRASEAGSRWAALGAAAAPQCLRPAPPVGHRALPGVGSVGEPREERAISSGAARYASGPAFSVSLCPRRS